MISEENAKVLAFFVQHAEDGVPEDRIPEWIDGRRIADLHAKKLLERRTVVPPGKEPLYPRGLSAYAIPPAGKDALAAFLKDDEQRAREEADKHSEKALEDKRWRKDARRSWVQWTVTTILTAASFFAGAIVEMLTGFIEWIVALFH